jgi:hypothetical protein
MPLFPLDQVQPATQHPAEPETLVAHFVPVTCSGFPLIQITSQIFETRVAGNRDDTVTRPHLLGQADCADHNHAGGSAGKDALLPR